MIASSNDGDGITINNVNANNTNNSNTNGPGGTVNTPPTTNDPGGSGGSGGTGGGGSGGGSGGSGGGSGGSGGGSGGNGTTTPANDLPNQPIPTPLPTPAPSNQQNPNFAGPPMPITAMPGGGGGGDFERGRGGGFGPGGGYGSGGSPGAGQNALGRAEFDHDGDNEWWVEVEARALNGDSIFILFAQVEGSSTWHYMKFAPNDYERQQQGWSKFAPDRAFQVPAGKRVLFEAHLTDGAAGEVEAPELLRARARRQEVQLAVVAPARRVRLRARRGVVADG